MAQIKEVGIFTVIEGEMVTIDIWYESGHMNEVVGRSFAQAFHRLPYTLQRAFSRPSAFHLVKVKEGSRVRGEWWQPTGE